MADLVSKDQSNQKQYLAGKVLIGEFFFDPKSQGWVQ